MRNERIKRGILYSRSDSSGEVFCFIKLFRNEILNQVQDDTASIARMGLLRLSFRLRSGVDSLTIPAMGQYRVKILSLVPMFLQILVFLFFFLLPTQLAKHFWPAWSYVQGIRVDYLSPTIAFIDIVSLLVIAFYMRTFVQFIRTTNRVIFIILGLLIGTNLLFSTLPLHSLFIWLRILLGFVVMFILVQNVKKYLSAILAGLVVSTAIQLLLVCVQYISQSSLQGIWYWLGERRIVLSLPDVAKISVYGREYLRPYGTFSHPNALGGFYVLLFFFVFWVKQQFSPTDGRSKLMASIILFVSPFLILTSFSKVAIFSFVLGSLILVWGDYTYRKCAVCLVARTSILIMVLLMFTVPIGDPYSLQKRLVLIGNSLRIFFDHPLWGVGVGNYIIAQSSISILPRYMPLYQPVHNVFLLVLTEVGVGGIMLIYFLVRQLKILMIGGAHLLPMLFVIFLTGMFDHYWITQSQTQLLLIFVTISILFIHPATIIESKMRPL